MPLFSSRMSLCWGTLLGGAFSLVREKWTNFGIGGLVRPLLSLPITENPVPYNEFEWVENISMLTENYIKNYIQQK